MQRNRWIALASAVLVASGVLGLFLYLFGTGAALRQEPEGAWRTATALVRLRIGGAEVVRLSNRKLVTCDRDGLDHYLAEADWREDRGVQGGGHLEYLTPVGRVDVSLEMLTSRCMVFEPDDKDVEWPHVDD